MFELAVALLDVVFALKMHGSCINGFTPRLASVADVTCSLKLSLSAREMLRHRGVPQFDEICLSCSIHRSCDGGHIQPVPVL